MCNVRATTAEDLEALSAVYIDAFAVVDPSEKWTSEKALALLKFFLDKQPDLAFVAVEDGEIGGGICGLVKPWWDGNHLVETELFVAPWCQKRGIATLLFSHFLESAIAKHDASVVESVTFKCLEFPLSWYLELGFEAKQDWQVIFGDTREVLSKLRKSA